MTKLSFDNYDNRPTFQSVSELRDALLGSYPGVDYFKVPAAVKSLGRDEDFFPAWAWLGQLLRTRPDWWPAVGIALQHAAQDGGEHARMALVELIESTPESIVLLPWTEPLARRWPDARASNSRTGFDHVHPLATLVANQRALFDGRPPEPVANLAASDTAPIFDLEAMAP